MNVLTNALPKGSTLIEKDGVPEYVVVPYHEFVRIFEKAEALIPNDVVGRFIETQSMVRAWREHLGLTQEEVAARLGISQPAYSKLESSARLRGSSRKRIVAALGIQPEQLV